MYAGEEFHSQRTAPMISYAQNFEDVILARVFRDRATGFYVDVGAMHPVLHSVTKHFYDSGWHGINIEPNPEFYERLVAERLRDQTLPYCIAETAGVRTFHVFANEGVSTLDPHIAEHFAARQFPRQDIQLEARPLREVLEAAPDDIDFLKIDVEGAELEVVRSNDWTRHRPTIVLVEAIDPRTLQPSWEPWEPELTGNGYSFVYFDGLNRFYLREDQIHLRRHFSAPPNVLDQFESSTVVEVRASREQCQKECDRLQWVNTALQQQLAAAIAWNTAYAPETDQIDDSERDLFRLQAQKQFRKMLEDAHTRIQQVTAELFRHISRHIETGQRLEELVRTSGAGNRVTEAERALEAERDRVSALTSELELARNSLEETRAEYAALTRRLEEELQESAQQREQARWHADAAASLQNVVLELQHRLDQNERERERLQQSYMSQRLWAGQLAQDKAAAVVRLREVEEQLVSLRGTL
jgi:FkbM family methyltransferase